MPRLRERRDSSEDESGKEAAAMSFIRSVGIPTDGDAVDFGFE
jgi:hypothetical protein